MDCRIDGSCGGYNGYQQAEDQSSGLTSVGVALPRSPADGGDLPLENLPPGEGRLGARFWGGLKAMGGALETAAGVALGTFTAWTGLGAAAGIGVAAHGGDTAIAGARQLWSGTPTRTATSQSIAALTGSETIGELADAGIGIAATGGAGLFSKAAAGERLLAKTTTWTTKLEAGTGYTRWFGSMCLSKLGSALDRAQVLAHEKVHSLLSPGAFAPFAQIRADLRAFLYSQSSFMRYSEEALAETSAQLATRGMSGLSAAEAIKTGVSFPLKSGYVRGDVLAAETAAVAAKAADTERRVWEAAK